MAKAAKGQYWTDAERSEAEFKVFMGDRISLLLTILVARATCGDVATSPNHWYLSLITALTATPAFCLFPLLDRIIASPWAERILFLLERLFVLFCLVSAPRGSLYFLYSLILSLFSLCVAAAYFLCFLDHLSHLSWIINTVDYIEINFLEICKSLGNKAKNIGKIVSTTAENCIREIRENLDRIEEYNNSEEERGGGVGEVRNIFWDFFCSPIITTGHDNSEEEEEDDGINNGQNVDKTTQGEEEEENNESDNRKMGTTTNKDEDEVKDEGVSQDWCNTRKKEECAKCCEYEARMLMTDKWWRDMMVDTIIESTKKQQEEQRKWEEEKAQLVGKLSAAIATAELYRNLLHDGMGDLWKSN